MTCILMFHNFVFAPIKSQCFLFSPLFGLNLNLSFSNLISSGVNFFDNLRKKTPGTPHSSATDSSSPRYEDVEWSGLFVVINVL